MAMALPRHMNTIPIAAVTPCKRKLEERPEDVEPRLQSMISHCTDVIDGVASVPRRSGPTGTIITTNNNEADSIAYLQDSQYISPTMNHLESTDTPCCGDKQKTTAGPSCGHVCSTMPHDGLCTSSSETTRKSVTKPLTAAATAAAFHVALLGSEEYEDKKWSSATRTNAFEDEDEMNSDMLDQKQQQEEKDIGQRGILSSLAGMAPDPALCDADVVGHEDDKDKRLSPATSTASFEDDDEKSADLGDDHHHYHHQEEEDIKQRSIFSSLARLADPITTFNMDAPLADIDAVDDVFKRAAVISAITYVVLVAVICYFGSTEDDLEDDSLERRVPQTAFFILLVSNVTMLLPIVMTRIRASSILGGTQCQIPNNHNDSHNPKKDGISGVLVAVVVIMALSMCTNALLGWGPRYVVIDPFIGSRVFLMRWAEWIPLAGCMTLLAESADISTHRHAWRAPIVFSLFQSLSTFCGICFPFCQTFTQWMCVMIFSCVTFVMIFPRVLARRAIFLRLIPGSTVLERENYDRRRFAYYLMALCAIFWTVLVGFYFLNLVIHTTLPPGHWLRFPALPMTCDTIADVVAKVFYTRIIVDAHDAIFASDLRTMRQLSELKRLMSILWISSSDVIVITTRHTKHRNATMLSPSFLALVGATPPLRNQNINATYHKCQQPGDRARDDGPNAGQSAALVLETDRGKLTSAYYVDTPAIAGDPHLINTDRINIRLAYEDLQNNVVHQALRISNAAWTSRNSDDPLRAVSINHCDESRECTKVLCEMKISRYTEQTAVAIVRDVTERYRRFETESRAHAETIARQRDMHTANRFTRHEVKNGLLAGIELCRTLGESLSKLKTTLGQGIVSVGNGHGRENDVIKEASMILEETAMKSLLDLDGTLHGVLNTVLAEVMAREVVHGVYQPRLEELDVPSMLLSELGLSKDRIPIIVDGGSMPKLLLDGQLIGHIHRNAVSNACKYGKSRGLVQTFVGFDSGKQQFKLEVTNEPGDDHEALLSLGDSAGEFIFAQGVRLQPHMNGSIEKNGSSGDGAWIMQKCAKVLKGECSIQFSKTVTTFTFQCPAVPVSPNEKPKYIDFVVPKDVWAIGVDDSKIQRKLISRIFSHIGVEASKQVLLGESPDDVTEFETTLMNLMEEHPGDRFLVIVDEHLDYDNLAFKQHEGVFSGSMIMKQALERMPKPLVSRCLVLMRSANDSAVDIGLYTQRTHGYFPKTIMQKDRTRQILAPLWRERFPNG